MRDQQWCIVCWPIEGQHLKMSQKQLIAIAIHSKYTSFLILLIPDKPGLIYNKVKGLGGIFWVLFCFVFSRSHFVAHVSMWSSYLSSPSKLDIMEHWWVWSVSWIYVIIHSRTFYFPLQKPEKNFPMILSSWLRPYNNRQINKRKAYKW
jgi:hypothetical protein